MDFISKFCLTAPSYRALVEHDTVLTRPDYEFANTSYSSPELFQVLIGCTYPRANLKILNNLGQWNVECDSRFLLEFLGNCQRLREFIPLRARDATDVDQILLTNTLRWPAYSVLYDACNRNPITDQENVERGTLIDSVVKELQMLGLGFPGTASELMTADERRIMYGKRKGRPAKIVIPTSWGTRLIEITTQKGIKVPPKCRDEARRDTNHRKDLHRKKRDGFTKQQLMEMSPVVYPPTPIENTPITPIVDTPIVTPPIADFRQQIDKTEYETVSFPDEESKIFTIDHRELPEDWDKEK